MMDADHSRFFASLSFVANVPLAGRVVADQDRGKAWRPMAGREMRFDLLGNLGADCFGEGAAVEFRGWHYEITLLTLRQLRGH